MACKDDPQRSGTPGRAQPLREFRPLLGWGLLDPMQWGKRRPGPTGDDVEVNVGHGLFGNDAIALDHDDPVRVEHIPDGSGG